MPYITPNATPTASKCWRISVPDDTYMLAALLGQLMELTEVWNWEDDGGITAQEAADIWDGIFEQFAVGSFCMIGSLIHYISTSPPDGVLDCDGTQYLRVDYPDLYAVLPIGLIVDADNFITPTIQDSVLLAAGSTYSPEDEGGSETHVLTESEMPAHTHTSDYPTFTIDVKSVGAPTIETGSDPPIPHGTSSTGGGNPHNNMPPYYAAKVGIIAK